MERKYYRDIGYKPFLFYDDYNNAYYNVTVLREEKT